MAKPKSKDSGDHCEDCGVQVCYGSKICRPCNFIRRKKVNRGMMEFVCVHCQKVYKRKDRGDVYNKKRRFCTQNCRCAEDSVCKKTNPEERAIWIKARHRARGYFWKAGMTDVGIKPSDVPDAFEVLVRLYVAKMEIPDHIRQTIERRKHGHSNN